MRRRKKPSKKTLAQREKQRAVERASLAQYQNPDQVLLFRQWCLLNNMSQASGRRIINSGAGPIVTQLGVRRIGITLRANRQWQESRARGA